MPCKVPPRPPPKLIGDITLKPVTPPPPMETLPLSTSTWCCFLLRKVEPYSATANKPRLAEMWSYIIGHIGICLKFPRFSVMRRPTIFNFDYILSSRHAYPRANSLYWLSYVMLHSKPVFVAPSRNIPVVVRVVVSPGTVGVGYPSPAMPDPPVPEDPTVGVHNSKSCILSKLASTMSPCGHIYPIWFLVN